MARIVDVDTDKIFLFGSLARGGVGSTSDVDFLVVRGDGRLPAARTTDSLDRHAAPRVAHLVVYTPEELERRPGRLELPAAALRDAEVVYERGRSP